MFLTVNFWLLPVTLVFNPVCLEKTRMLADTCCLSPPQESCLPYLSSLLPTQHPRAVVTGWLAPSPLKIWKRDVP